MMETKDEKMIEEPAATPQQEELAAEERPQEAAQQLKELQEAIKKQAREDENPHSTQQTLRSILGGDWLTGKMIISQIGVVLLIVVITIIYVSNRYICQKNMLEIDRLKTELQDAKFRSLSSTSELTEICRESNVLEMLRHSKDSVLKISQQPPYIINIPEDE